MKPIPGGALQSARQFLTGAIDIWNGWFGPGQPVAPVVPNLKPRGWDYPVGQNLTYTPRAFEAVSYAEMRYLADNYDLLRLMIETRKDQMAKMPPNFRLKIGPNDTPKEIHAREKKDPRIQQLQEFFEYPDKRNTWQDWVRIIGEEMLVTDATCILPTMTRAGEPYCFEVIDGATIKPIVNEQGRTPIAPDPAYQQVLHGVPAIVLTSDQLLYYPRNKRVNKIYGMSPVEQIIMTVNIALRRQLHQLQYYTEGSVPDAIVSVPETWTPDQIRQFDLWWNSLMAGNTAERRKVKFIPEPSKITFTREQSMKDEMDDWLARIVCFAFSIPPTMLTKQTNRAVAGTMMQQAMEEGLIPVLKWYTDLMNLIIRKYFGWNDIEFAFEDPKREDPIETAKIHDIYVKDGILSIDECREELGKDPLGIGNMIQSAQGPTMIDDAVEMSGAKLEQTKNPPQPAMPGASGDAKGQQGKKPQKGQAGKNMGPRQCCGGIGEHKVTCLHYGVGKASVFASAAAIRRQRLLDKLLYLREQSGISSRESALKSAQESLQRMREQRKRETGHGRY